MNLASYIVLFVIIAAMGCAVAYMTRCRRKAKHEGNDKCSGCSLHGICSK